MGTINMKLSHVFLLSIQLIVATANAESLDKAGVNTKPAQASADSVADLFIGVGGSTETSPQLSPPVVQPTYESWDVLRQYPRHAPLPPPSVPEQKTQELQKETKEKPDV